MFIEATFIDGGFFSDWGEIRPVIQEKRRKIQKKYKIRRIVTRHHIQHLKEIVNEHPEYFLDELAEELLRRTHSSFSLSTISQILRNDLNLSLKVCFEVARQQNEHERALYQQALKNILSVFEDAGMLVYIDETHKDRNASRRRRAWGKKTRGGGVKLDRWFKNTARYTMIIGCDTDGFITETCQLIHRNEISDEGAAGTVDRDAFKEWVRHFLVPNLGNFTRGERRSIVVMDNASTHMDEEVGTMIRNAGALLLYTAPYSPDLNPIEKMFNLYKMDLKRNELDFANDLIGTHWRALRSVTRDIAIKEFRKCNVPYSNDLKTSDEENDITSLNKQVQAMNKLYLLMSDD